LHLDAEFSAGQLARLHAQLSLYSGSSDGRSRRERTSRGWSAWWNGAGAAAHHGAPPDARVLDIWCRFGETLAYHKVRAAGENGRCAASHFAHNVHIDVFESHLYDPEYFDCVTLNHVIEHSTDPVRLLAGMARVLRIGGTAVVSTPNPEGPLAKLTGRRWMNWHAPYRLQFFTKKSMRSAANAAGLDLVGAKTITDSQWISLQWWHLLSRPPIGSASPLWIYPCNKPLLVGTQGKRVSLHQKMHLNNLVARGLDAFGMGDNRVYVLRKS
jgi:SAM-dependent methyltransferase